MNKKIVSIALMISAAPPSPDVAATTSGMHRFWRCRSFAIAVLLLATLSTFVFAAQGDLDPTFGQGGRVMTNITVPGYQYFYPVTESMLVQPDGKILVCGRFWEDGLSFWYGTYIVRYLPDGTLDTSFGTNGKVAVIGPGVPFGNQSAGAEMALQPDGMIVLIGMYNGYGEGIVIHRYTSSGMLDSTFGTNGSTLVSGIEFERGTSIALQPDGRIVGVGWDFNPYTTPYYSAILVFRLNTNGTLDGSFGSAGTGVVLIANGYDGAEVLAQPDGKILVVGSEGTNILLARYTSNGSLDPSFGTGGSVTQRINNINFSGAALQPDGKTVVIGSAYSNGQLGSTLFVRYNANGSPDTSFGTTGVSSVESDFLKEPNTVLFQSDGKIIAIGNAADNATGRNGFAIVRLTSNGSPDSSFGIGGRSVFPINAGGTNYAYSSDGVMQTDGKILVAGYFRNYYTDSHERIALIRVIATPGVTVSGRVTTPGGQGLRNAVVMIADSLGTRRLATTSSFGFYTFESVSLGESYTISVSSRRYRFSARVTQVNGDLANVDFIGLE
ncbi:MAG: carboxypeptidase regulatory-like domain-containing protein [Pyrinomonadaceae bacterium]